MKFSIVVYGAPYSNEAASTALQFGRALLEQGHELYRLFLISDGVHTASRMAVVPQDENSLQSQWDAFIEAHGVDSVVCVTSALRRGIIDSEESTRHELQGATLSDHSSIAGLGQWVDALLNSDRVVSFG